MNRNDNELIKYSSNATDFIKKYLLLIILICTCVIGIIISPAIFPSPTNIQNILFSCCIYGIITVGQALVMLVKEIDLSVGSIVAFAPVTSIFIINKIMIAATQQSIIVGGNYIQASFLPIVLLTILIGALVGIANGVIVVKLKVPSLITTLGMLNALAGLTYLFSGGYAQYLTKIPNVNWIGTNTVSGILPVSFIVYLAIGLTMVWLLGRTKFGKRIYSTGGNEKAALFSGINTGKWKTISFGLSGMFAGVAAILYSSRLESVEAIQGQGYELFSIAIAVIGGITLQGGKGTMAGTILAALILSIVLNIMSLLGLVSWYQTIITGLIIVFAALMHTYTEKSKTKRLIAN
jgi:ribose/xylose/arabinose/galactoside ABC-type transport system permease subunit